MSQGIPVDQDNRSGLRTVLLAADLKNSVLTEVDAGNLNFIAYSPYGQQSSQLEVLTRLGFNGELREVRLEWYLLGNGHRAYNPRLRRFQSPDSLSPFGKGGLNAYMYCGGEPMMNSDPTGKTIWAASKMWQQLTQRVANVTTQAVSTTVHAARNAMSSTASVIGSGASKMSTAIGNAKQKVIAATVGSEPFPVPPRVTPPSITPNFSSRPIGFSNRPNQVRQQMKTAQGKTAAPTGRGRANGKKIQVQSSTYNHVQTTIDANQYTSLLDKRTGEVVATIRSN